MHIVRPDSLAITEESSKPLACPLAERAMPGTDPQERYLAFGHVRMVVSVDAPVADDLDKNDSEGASSGTKSE